MSEAEKQDYNNFPKNFYFGAATSAHQVEGGNHNDWTEWEQATAKLKVKSAKLKVWPGFILKNYPNPLQEENYISGKACDHYNRFREDFDIAKSLGHNAHRFSMEWSRIEPEEGRFNEKEIEHYREVIEALRKRDMEPFVTLWHWTLPLWVAKQGGWNATKTADDFVSFAKRMGMEFQDDIKYWITFNEPGSWAAHAYLLGMFPPQRHSIASTVRVYFNFIRAQRALYRSLKRINPLFEIGVAESMEWYRPAWFRLFVNYLRNFFFLNRIKDSLDFIGVNYYRSISLGNGDPITDLGWGIFPKGIFYLLKESARFGKPIFVTENGLADAKDEKRGEFISDHIFWMKKAIAEGCDVRGYFHWSLLDNFEWNSGFWPRFGLVEVDYRTMERKVRESAKIYTKIIQNPKFKNQNDNV